MKKIAFHKTFITADEVKSVSQVLKSGWLTMGPQTVKFESEFKKYIGSKYAVAVNSCTAALHLALEAIGLREGDEVIVPSITFPATSEVVCYFKAKPIFVDVEKDTLNIDVSKLESHITSRTKVIIPVHYGGQPVDLREVMSIARKYRLYVIEDAAHALPSWYHGKRVGVIGDITCFSFYATKTLTTGEGGMVTTQRKKWADRMKVMRLHGMNRDAWKRYSGEGSWFYEVVDAGFKYNMNDIQAAIGIEQLKKLDLMWKKRKIIAEKYNNAFREVKEVIAPFIKNDRETSWHLYPIRLNLDNLRISRNEFIEEMGRRGVCTSVHFIPLYRHPFYKKTFDFKRKYFPNSEWLYQRIVSLPIYPSMSERDVYQVIKAVRDTVDKNRR